MKKELLQSLATPAATLRAKKGNVAKVLTQTLGLIRYDAYHYLGNCNDAVLSGYCIDNPPGSIYVWRFALPAYDDISYLHLALGERVFDFRHGGRDSKENAKFADVLAADWKQFSEVRDCKKFVEYISSSNFSGAYALWTRYITHIWCKEFEAAERISQSVQVITKIRESVGLSSKLDDLNASYQEGGWGGCHGLLREWQARTREAYCISSP